MTEEDIKYLVERLHSPEMKCRQCDITRAMLREWTLMKFRESEMVGA